MMSRSARRNKEPDEAAMRAAGLRPVTIWVPDLTTPAAAAEYRRQSKLLAAADADDPTIDSFLEAAWRELDQELSESEK